LIVLVNIFERKLSGTLFFPCAQLKLKFSQCKSRRYVLTSR